MAAWSVNQQKPDEFDPRRWIGEVKWPDGPVSVRMRKADVTVATFFGRVWPLAAGRSLTVSGFLVDYVITPRLLRAQRNDVRSNASIVVEVVCLIRSFNGTAIAIERSSCWRSRRRYDCAILQILSNSRFDNFVRRFADEWLNCLVNRPVVLKRIQRKMGPRVTCEFLCDFVVGFRVLQHKECTQHLPARRWIHYIESILMRRGGSAL